MFFDIKEWEGQYKISEDGKDIISVKRSYKGARGRIFFLKEKKMRLNVSKGYIRVQLCKNGVIKLCMVHRLVAETFIPNPENKPQVNPYKRNKIR